MKKPPTLRLLTLILFLFLACMTLVYISQKICMDYKYGQLGTFDFIQYWTAGQLFLDGKNPFDWDENFKLQKSLGWTYSIPLVMKNPPWLLAWLYPLMATQNPPLVAGSKSPTWQI